MSGKGGLLRSYFLGFGAGCVLFVVYLATLLVLRQFDLGATFPWPTAPRTAPQAAPDPTLQKPPPPPANYRGPGARKPARRKAPARAAASKHPPKAPARERVRLPPPAKRAASPARARKAPAKTRAVEPASASATSLYDRGLDHMTAGEYRQAVEQFNRALARRGRFAPAYKGLGLAYQRLGNKDMARAAFGRYLSLNPKAPDADLVRQWMENE